LENFKRSLKPPNLIPEKATKFNTSTKRCGCLDWQEHGS